MVAGTKSLLQRRPHAFRQWPRFAARPESAAFREVGRDSVRGRFTSSICAQGGAGGLDEFFAGTELFFSAELICLSGHLRGPFYLFGRCKFPKYRSSRMMVEFDNISLVHDLRFVH